MGRKGVTPADVVAACVALKRQGRAVGLRTLRLELSRGSYGTIAKRLRQLALVEVVGGVSTCSGTSHLRRLGFKLSPQTESLTVDSGGVSEGV